MGTKLRAAIVGTGFIGGVHARAARAAGAELVAVGASTPERSDEAVERLGARRALNSPEELATCDDIDVVHVCTPNRLHAGFARAALEAGKHVLCEKPLSIDGSSAAELVELANRSGLVATVPFVYRYYPAVRHARAGVARGDLGDLRLIHGSYLQDWMSEPTDWSWRVDPDVNGPSRAFADIGSHWCDLVEFTTGQRITRLVARLDTVIPERVASEHTAAFEPAAEPGATWPVSTEDVGLVLFETDRGARGSVVVSQVSPGRKNRLWFEIDGARGSAVWDQELPESLWLGGREASTDVARGSTLMSGDAARLSELPPGHPQGYRDCFDAYVRDTYDRIDGHERPGLPTFRDGLRAARIVDAVLASSKTDRWVEVAP